MPDCAAISNGRYTVPHFTNKARVDEIVSAAGFGFHTFVEPPMYFQNFLTTMAPFRNQDGGETWSFPMPGDSRTIHAGDVRELGVLVASAFANPDRAGAGRHLAMCGGRYSWDDLVRILREQGRDISFTQVDADHFDALFPGAPELREMMQYWTEYTYFGPDHESKVAAANALVPAGFTGFADWARRFMPT